MVLLNNVIGIIRMKKFNYKLEIEIFRNSTQKNLGVQKGTQTPCWLRPCWTPKPLKSTHQDTQILLRGIS